MSRAERNDASRLGKLLLLLLIVLSPFILVGLSIYFLYSLLLYAAVTVLWLSRGKDILLVYSDSHVWESYVKARIIPLVNDRSVLLNWSERARWKKLSLGVACFHHFGGRREFNPMAVVFRPFRRGRVFRFYSAFRDYKHANHQALDALQREFFEYAGIADAGAALAAKE